MTQNNRHSGEIVSVPLRIKVLAVLVAIAMAVIVVYGLPVLWNRFVD